MKIKNFALSRLRDEEHFQFFTSFRDLVLVFGALALKIELLFNLFLAAYAMSWWHWMWFEEVPYPTT